MRTKLLPILAALLLPHLAAIANPTNFTVQAVSESKTFKLADARGKFVALHFLLKTECPLCLRHTRDYAAKSASDSRAVHIFLKPDSEEEIKQWRLKFSEKSQAPTIYRDPDAQLAKAYNIPDGYKFHGQTVHYPALVLLDAEGKEVFLYVGKSNADRLSYEKFSAKLDELAKAAKP